MSWTYDSVFVDYHTAEGQNETRAFNTERLEQLGSRSRFRRLGRTRVRNQSALLPILGVMRSTLHVGEQSTGGENRAMIFYCESSVSFQARELKLNPLATNVRGFGNWTRRVNLSLEAVMD
jgi:hypothetical protein